MRSNEKSLLELSVQRDAILVGATLGPLNGHRFGARDISPKTVARHRERIMHKLDLHSSTELVKFAIRTGLIQVG